MTIGKLRGATGDESFAVTGRLGIPASVAFVPADAGLQILVEDLGDDGRRILDWTAPATAIPPGAPGTGCDPKDGWSAFAYKNASNAVDPPACTPGSAQGLRSIRVKDRRAKGKGVAFHVVGRGARLATPAGPLRVTLVLGADASAGLDGACGIRTFEAGACRARRGGFRCR